MKSFLWKLWNFLLFTKWVDCSHKWVLGKYPGDFDCDKGCGCEI